MEWSIWITWWVYSLSDIQDYFENFIENYQTLTGNLRIIIYVNKMKIKLKK